MEKEKKVKFTYVEPKAYFPPEIWKILDGEADEEKSKEKSRKTTKGTGKCTKKKGVK